MRTINSAPLVALALRLTALGATFVLQVILARSLGEAEYGYYMYLLALATVLGTLSTLGLDTLCLRSLPALLSNRGYARAKGLLAFSTAAVLAIATVAATILFVAPGGPTSHPGDAVFAAAALVPALSLARLRTAAYRGLQRPVEAEFFETFLPSVALLAIVLSLSRHFSLAQHALLANNAAVLLGLVVGAALLMVRVPPEVWTTTSILAAPTWIRSAAGFLLISTSQIILAESDIAMLGMLSSTQDSGFYSAASRLAAFAVLPMTVMNLIAAPQFAQHHANTDKQALQSVIRNTARLGLAATLVAVAAVALLSDQLLRLFGEGFTTATGALFVLLSAQALNAAAGPVGHILLMTGHERRAAMLLFASALLNILLNAVAIPFLGVLGASLATGATIIAWNVLMLTYIVRRLGLRPSAI